MTSSPSSWGLTNATTRERDPRCSEFVCFDAGEQSADHQRSQGSARQGMLMLRGGEVVSDFCKRTTVSLRHVHVLEEQVAIGRKNIRLRT